MEKTLSQESKLVSINKKLSDEVEKFIYTSVSIQGKLNNIYYYCPSDEKSLKKSDPVDCSTISPPDIISDIMSRLEALERANEKLNKIYEHLSLIG